MAGFQKAKREQIWVKVLFTGPSGSGKTYSALRMATGFAAKDGGRVAFVDTENGRVRYYANEFDFDEMQLTAPYTSEKYMDAIALAISAGYRILVIDSLSHEWLWCNDVVNNMPGNSFQNWGKVKTQHHNKLMEQVIQSPIHIFATARGKDKWSIEEKDGKKTPRKVGEGSVQSDDVEYNYTVTFNLTQDSNVATCTKDNTHIFEGRYEKITEEDGKKLYDWANTGEKPAPKQVEEFVPAETRTIDDVHNDIKDAIAAKMKDGFERAKMVEIIKGVCGVANYQKISDPEIAEKILAAVQAA